VRAGRQLPFCIVCTYRDVLLDATETRSELITAYSDAGDASEAYWLTYRLLWAIPWSARDVPPTARAATRLGATFDEVILSRRHASRPLADSWVAWSSKWTQIARPLTPRARSVNKAQPLATSDL
jgi:hypothetical protein